MTPLEHLQEADRLLEQARESQALVDRESYLALVQGAQAHALTAIGAAVNWLFETAQTGDQADDLDSD
jgi:hypothetical protein